MNVFAQLRLACLLMLLTWEALGAQTVVAFQGGEGTAADNWGFVPIANAGGAIPPGIVAAGARTGSFAIRAGGGSNLGCTSGTNCITGGANTATGCPMHGTAIQFNPINTACLTGVQLSVYHRSQPSLCSGAGFDGSDKLHFEVRENGGAWTTVQTMDATGDYLWSYATNPAGIPATVPNPWIYNVTPGTTSFEFRVRATVNRSDEVFYLDDVTLTTTSTGYNFPGTAGLWNGVVDDNWFNACNWDDRAVPTALTNVTFPTGSANDIVVQPGQNCICNNLTCTGGIGRAIKAAGDPTKVLTVLGDISLNSSTGSTVLQMSDYSFGTPDGVLNLSGNWTNNAGSADFVEGEGTVNLVGGANQTITMTSVQPTEDFFNLTVNKGGGDVVLAKSVVASGQLSLLSGKVTTAANSMIVANPLPSAVTGHSTISYVNGNLLRTIQTGGGTRLYDFPLGTAANYELASLNLINPAGFSVIAGFFNPSILGAPVNLVESGFVFDQILNAGLWTLAPNAPYVGTYDLTLVERGYTNGNASRYIDVKRTDAFTLWSNPGAHVSFSEVAGVVTCTRSGLTTFNEFAIALSNTPLALDDLVLTASPIGHGDVGIGWNWSDELVQGKFDLVRVVDGQETSLGEWNVDPALVMEVLDAAAPTGRLLYNLYHTDLDGQRRLTAATEVINRSDDRIVPILWPNPNAGTVHLQLGKAADWQVTLLRIDGAEVLASEGMAEKVQAEIEEAVPSLAAGIYMLQCKSGNETFHLKMVKR